MAQLSRLSPYNIIDDLRRTELYRDIRNNQSNIKWFEYVIQPCDILSPDLIAYKVYGNAELKWLILIASGVDDMREQLLAGTSIRLPSSAWIRQQIKKYISLEQQYG